MSFEIASDSSLDVRAGRDGFPINGFGSTCSYQSYFGVLVAVAAAGVRGYRHWRSSTALVMGSACAFAFDCS